MLPNMAENVFFNTVKQHICKYKQMLQQYWIKVNWSKTIAMKKLICENPLVHHNYIYCFIQKSAMWKTLCSAQNVFYSQYQGKKNKTPKPRLWAAKTLQDVGHMIRVHPSNKLVRGQLKCGFWVPPGLQALLRWRLSKICVCSCILLAFPILAFPILFHPIAKSLWRWCDWAQLCFESKALDPNLRIDGIYRTGMLTLISIFWTCMFQAQR